EYDSGARVYPDDLGIQAVADAVDLAALARAAPARCPTGIPVSGSGSRFCPPRAG
ncbi:MAG: hypothetical protein QOF38_4694, partial [Pseudonocardiales bacterium]|nr:hypothetical protein [Pseudonocardiales bacterium]